jgi:hypothetical protein
MEYEQENSVNDYAGKRSRAYIKRPLTYQVGNIYLHILSIPE